MNADAIATTIFAAGLEDVPSLDPDRYHHTYPEERSFPLIVL